MGKISDIKEEPRARFFRFFPDCAAIWGIYVVTPCLLWYGIGQSNDIPYCYFIYTEAIKMNFPNGVKMTLNNMGKHTEGIVLMI